MSGRKRQYDISDDVDESSSPAKRKPLPTAKPDEDLKASVVIEFSESNVKTRISVRHAYCKDFEDPFGNEWKLESRVVSNNGDEGDTGGPYLGIFLCLRWLKTAGLGVTAKYEIKAEHATTREQLGQPTTGKRFFTDKKDENEWGTRDFLSFDLLLTSLVENSAGINLELNAFYKTFSRFNFLNVLLLQQ